MSSQSGLDDYQLIVRALSDRLVEAQTPIRVLDAVKWDDSIRSEFLKHKGKQLSGGEQQMLAIARALGSRPQFLMFDEPTEGLAPLIVERISDTILELKRQDVSMLLVTQDTTLAMKVSKRIFFMEKGSIRYEGSSQDVADHPEIRLRYLGV